VPDYLQREQAPPGIEHWAAIDQIVVRTAQSMLVGRRFLSLVGPFGPGVEVLPNGTVGSARGAHVDLLGNAEGDAIDIEQRRFLPLPLLYQDFWLHWRDLEASQQLGVPLDLGKAAAAAAATAQAEDRLIFDGHAALGLRARFEPEPAQGHEGHVAQQQLVEQTVPDHARKAANKDHEALPSVSHYLVVTVAHCGLGEAFAGSRVSVCRV
jgi:uncharacterized linocin/CFP29 family protein